MLLREVSAYDYHGPFAYLRELREFEPVVSERSLALPGLLLGLRRGRLSPLAALANRLAAAGR
jgi:hypothetical protein